MNTYDLLYTKHIHKYTSIYEMKVSLSIENDWTLITRLAEWLSICMHDATGILRLPPLRTTKVVGDAPIPPCTPCFLAHAGFFYRFCRNSKLAKRLYRQFKRR